MPGAVTCRLRLSAAAIRPQVVCGIRSPVLRLTIPAPIANNFDCPPAGSGCPLRLPAHKSSAGFGCRPVPSVAGCRFWLRLHSSFSYSSDLAAPIGFARLLRLPACKSSAGFGHRSVPSGFHENKIFTLLPGHGIISV